MSIPLLLVCDGAETKQATLEGLVKNEPGLKYIATASMQEGSRAVERAVKVGAKLVWIDLDEEPVEGLNLLAETRKLHPMLNVIVSRSQLDPDMVRAALQLGALDFLDPARAAQQLNVVVENLRASGQIQSTASQQGIPAASGVAQHLASTDPHLSPGATPALAAGGGNKWGDLDSIPTPGAKGAPQFGQDVTGEIHVANSGIQNAVASQAQAQSPAHAQAAQAAQAQAAQAAAAQAAQAQAAQAAQVSPQVRPTAELPTAGSKWGDLDSIPTPAAAGAPAAPAVPVAAAPSPVQAPAAAPAPAPVPAPLPAPAPAPLPAPAPAPAQPVAPAAAAAPATAPGGAAANANNPSGGKWGDLDAIPTPKAALEPAPKPTAEVVRPMSALDSIPTPAEKPPLPLPKPEPHIHTNKALRPSPEKAELYSMGSPVMMAVVIILIIFAMIAFMYFKGHH